MRLQEALQDASHRLTPRILVVPYLTKKGPKTGGPLKGKRDAVAALEEQRRDLAAKSERLRQELDRRRDLRRELASLEDSEEEAGRGKRLAEAEAVLARALRHAELLEGARNAEHTKRVEAGRAEEWLASLERDLSELAEATGAHWSAREQAERAMEELRGTESRMSKAGKILEVARAHAGAAVNILQKVLRAESVAAAAGRRKELVEKIERAENLRRRIEQASAEARKELSEPVLRELERLDEAVRVLRGARELNAVAIAMTYSPGRSDGVSLAGKPLPDGERVSVPDGARLEILGIGQLEIYPGKRPDGETLAEAEAELARAFEAAGATGIEDVQASAHRRREADLRERNAEADLRSVAPDGIDALRDELAAIPEPIESEEGLPAVEEARQEDEAARETQDRAAEDHDAARTAHGHAQTTAARAAADAENAGTRKARAMAALSEIDDPEAERAVRQEALSCLRGELKDAIRQREEKEAVAPDLEAARLALERARSIAERADRDSRRIREDLKVLDTSISIHAGDAVDEELTDVDVCLEAARSELDAIEFEVAVLETLRAALKTARETARDRYVEPVMKELVPLLRLFWPEAEVRFDPETLLPKALVRAGTEEDFHILSGGTQEQIALLVRLAFARMLARTGTPAPVILDDAIVHTDDNRIEQMFYALKRQAHDIQIVVFSCRQKAFSDLRGRGLAIVPVKRAQDSR